MHTLPCPPPVHRQPANCSSSWTVLMLPEELSILMCIPLHCTAALSFIRRQQIGKLL
jgi:hypothetical protein